MATISHLAGMGVLRWSIAAVREARISRRLKPIGFSTTLLPRPNSEGYILDQVKCEKATTSYLVTKSRRISMELTVSLRTYSIMVVKLLAPHSVLLSLIVCDVMLYGTKICDQSFELVIKCHHYVPPSCCLINFLKLRKVSYSTL